MCIQHYPCMTGMKSGVFDQKQIRDTKYNNLPCIASIYGKDRITTEDLNRYSKRKSKEHIKDVLDCASSFSSQAQEMFPCSV
jgi:hypothetical protein